MVYNEWSFVSKNRTMQYKKITSLTNPLIREILRQKKEKTGHSLVVEGRRLIEMALSSNTPVERVFFTDTFKAKHDLFLTQLSRKASALIETSDHVLSKIADTETPQGIVALITYRVRNLSEVSLGTNPLIVVCDGVRDPGNLGTIIRAADSAGADAVILLPGTCDPFLPKGIRATAGSIFNLSVLFSRPEAIVEWLRKRSVSLIAADVHALSTIYEADMKKPMALAFGNEAAGVSAYLKRSSNMMVSIPMPGKTESLNVATSAAICLYEAVRQRREPT